MQCPKCQLDNAEQARECRKCGIVFAKYVRHQDVAVVTPGTPSRASTWSPEQRRELICRVVAFPASLLLMHLLVNLSPGFLRLLTMWVHELGHTFTAWLGGFSATPGPWFTSIGDQRNLGVTAFVFGCLAYGGFYGWKTRRWGLLAVAAASVLVQVAMMRLYSDQAMALVIFGGDAGCLVLGALLMMTFYVPEDSVIYQNDLRWGLLPIGAASLMDVYHVWTGGPQSVPFGENENGLSDPSVLTEMYNWPIQVLIQRYVHLATYCFGALALVYIYGIVTAFPAWSRAARSAAQTEET